MKLVLVSILAAAVLAQPVAAQKAPEKPVAGGTPEKQKISFKVPASNTKYRQQHVLDVGDVPGHQIRVFEIHRTFQQAAVASGAQDGTQATASAKATASASTPLMPRCSTASGRRNNGFRESLTT